MLLGFREFIALAALAVAAGIGLSFALADTQPDPDRPPRQATAGARATAAREAERITVAPIQGEAPWRLAFFRLEGDKTDLVSGSELPALDLSFTREPLPELRGSGWRVVAQMTFSGPPGSYEVKLQYRGSAVIRADASDLVRSASPNRTRVMMATFEKGVADMTLSVELDGAAAGGVARWQLTPR
ncbi:MAG: hypothetical protein ACKVVT_16255 [Dehalococcoidia bacterium]